MKFKPIFKILWISLLSTFTLVLSQALTTKGFENINTIRLFFLEVPIKYLAINFLVFVMLTIVFMLLNDKLPVHKLLKGVVYSLMVSFVWVVLQFQPITFETATKYIFDSIVFMIPMLFYGIFLGYLATEKTVVYEEQSSFFGFLSISIIWILFHLIYMVISESAEGQLLSYIVWLVIAGLIIGLIFGVIYDFSLSGTKNGLFITIIAVILIFGSYYAYQYALNDVVDVQLLIRIALDTTSIMLAIQFSEIYLYRVKKEVSWK